ncbi:hypothetical protein V1512DRAFT_259464, partial [Lipomyces arxii]|uniref:uncharacterized protein n=1 Tax=Lipomyces arxii TaxID=56418 RepID=UPI0034CF0945
MADTIDSRALLRELSAPTVLPPTFSIGHPDASAVPTTCPAAAEALQKLLDNKKMGKHFNAELAASRTPFNGNNLSVFVKELQIDPYGTNLVGIWSGQDVRNNIESKPATAPAGPSFVSAGQEQTLPMPSTQSAFSSQSSRQPSDYRLPDRPADRQERPHTASHRHQEDSRHAGHGNSSRSSSHHHRNSQHHDRDRDHHSHRDSNHRRSDRENRN